MSRAEDILEEVIDVTKSLANAADRDVPERAARLVETLEGQRGKFLYRTLAGVPPAVRCRKAVQAAVAAAESDDASALAPAVSQLEAKVQEMVDGADAPGIVLT